MMGAFVDAVLRGHLDPEQDPGFAAGLHTRLALDARLRTERVLGGGRTMKRAFVSGSRLPF
jgi:hypothetical protein